MAKRDKQTVIAGLAPQYHDDLDEAVREYVEARDIRMEQTKEETRTQAELAAKMKEKKLKRYKTPEGLEATYMSATAEKVKVKSPKEPGENGAA